MASEQYRPEDWGKKEVEMMRKFNYQVDDARTYFTTVLKPRMDRSYKLYIAYNGDRAKEIQKWQANFFVPYTQAVIETLMPRILDARPDFSVQGRNEDDQIKANKIVSVGDYTWEISGMDNTSELIVRSSLVYGTGFMQTSWKKDKRTQKFLVTKDLGKKKYTWKEEERVFYDAPYTEWVDNYSLWYDWHNVPRESKQYWFKRLLLTGSEIKRRYPNADKERLDMALKASGDLTDYTVIRNETKLIHEKALKGEDYNPQIDTMSSNRYASTTDPDLRMHEVFEWWRPFDDAYAAIVNNVPILKGGFIPNPYDHKDAPFIDVPFLKLMGEYEGMGLPMILENPQLMLNMIKNQRLDSTTLSIHKMWIVNPLAGIDKRELVVRPFGIIYSPDPNGVKEVQFSDIKSSAYREEDLLKNDMRYASGVDDFSMGVGGGAASATEVRHLRESTLERVRLYINHLGDAYAKMMRHWICMWRQFLSQEMTIRIIGDDGRELFPLIEKDDLSGEYDYRAMVIPSFAGKSDVDKKQGMDLFQLLINLPFVDPRKLTSKILHNWNWSLDSVAKAEEEQQSVPGMPGEPGMPGASGAPSGDMAQLLAGGNPEEMGAAANQPTEIANNRMPELNGSGEISPDVIQQALKLLGGNVGQNTSAFAQAGMPINLLQGGPLPPTVKGVPGKTTNPRGLNRTGKVNTNIPIKQNHSEGSQLLNRSQNIQR